MLTHWVTTKEVFKDAHQRPGSHSIRKRATHALWLVLLLSFQSAPLPSYAATDAVDTDLSRSETYLYTVAFHCGQSSEAFQEGYVSGVYATGITIINPATEIANFKKSFVRSLPFQKSGASASFEAAKLQPGESIGIECDEIRTHLPSSMTAQMRTGYISILSDTNLIVTATYSARPEDGQISTTDTLRIDAKVLPPERSIFEATGICGLIERSAVLVEGQIRDVTFTYDPVIGPRETITLGNVTTHFGSDVGSEIVIRNLRGLVADAPEPTFIEVPQIPRFTSDGHYLVYLTRLPWFYSPVTLDAAFRVETIGTQEVLIDQAGHALNPAPTENAFFIGEKINPDSVFAPQPLALKQIFETRFNLDDPNAPKAMLPGVSQSTVENAFDRSDYLNFVGGQLANCKQPFEGEVPSMPSEGRVWNKLGSDQLANPQEGLDGGVPCGDTDPETGATRVCADE